MELGEGFAGGLDLLVGGIKLEESLVLGDRFVALVELLGHLGEEQMGVRVVRQVFDGILAAHVGGIEVAAVAIEAGDREVFGLAIVVGLEILDLRELAPGDLGCVVGCRRGHVRVVGRV